MKKIANTKASPKSSSNQGNTPDPNAGEGLKGHKKNVIAPKGQGGTGSKGPASPL